MIFKPVHFNTSLYFLPPEPQGKSKRLNLEDIFDSHIYRNFLPARYSLINTTNAKVSTLKIYLDKSEYDISDFKWFHYINALDFTSYCAAIILI